MSRKKRNTNNRKAQTINTDSGEVQSTNKAVSILGQYRTLIAVMFVAVIIVFFLLPALAIFLAAVWPNAFSGDGAAKALSDNVNKVIGVISIILGGISIYLAVKTDKVFQEQKQQQDSFMRRIEDYTRNMSQSIDKLLYDKTTDKSDARLRSSAEANEAT